MAAVWFGITIAAYIVTAQLTNQNAEKPFMKLY
jgi:hypothetical protein